MLSIKTNKYEISVLTKTSDFVIKLSTSEIEDGVELVYFKMEAEKEILPEEIEICWEQPIVDIQARWNPSESNRKVLSANWGDGLKTKATAWAPVTALYNNNGNNRLTFAFSDALNPIIIKAGVQEETSCFKCKISLFVEPSNPIKHYEAILRLDTRNIQYYESLKDVGKWWSSISGYEPAPVPEIATLPMYSTWYSFHQLLVPDEIVKQCEIAKKLGCEAVIVDDGWQTSNSDRGYAYCGDWKADVNRIPDMRALVNQIHKLGMKFILWYSVPFVGIHSKAWTKFKDKLLKTNWSEDQWRVLDPRYPDVREYLINIYENAVREWDLDGFKLDFVDSFNLDKDSIGVYRPEMDYISLPEAVDILLKDTFKRLHQLKPQIMVEFRQSYIGPLMRTYGNMFRASDCPNDSLQNRIRTLDIRLLSGNTAAHADMLMWNINDTVESAALQIINILFSVPQISVLLDKLPKEHYDMIKFYLKFWRENRDVLLYGKLCPIHPEASYTSVTSTNDSKIIAVVYTPSIVTIKNTDKKKLIIVNGTLENRIVFETMEDYKGVCVEVNNCKGEVIRKEIIDIAKGLNTVDTPAAGITNFIFK